MPDPSSWGWESFKTNLMGRPPFSTTSEVSGVVTGVVAGFEPSSSGGCGAFMEFGDGLELDCSQIEHRGLIRTLLSMMLIAGTVLAGWRILRRAVNV